MPDSATALAILGGGGGPPPAMAAAAVPTPATPDDPIGAKLAILRQGIAGTLPEAPEAPTRPSFTGDVAQQASEGWRKITEAATEPDTGIIPTRIPRMLAGVGQIAGAPVYAAGQRIERQFPALTEAQHQGQILPLESPADVINTTANLAGFGVKPRTAPVGVPPSAPPEVTLTKGMETGDPELWRQETMARRGLLGKAAQDRAELSDAQRAQQVADLKERIGQSFDQFGQTIAQSPQDAAALAQGAIQRAAQTQKAGVDAGFAQARALGRTGEVNPSALEGAGGQIRATLSNRPDPVIVDDQLTPWAGKILSEADKVGDIQNRAALPGTGVSLESIAQARQRMVQMRRGAWTNNPVDGRAASAAVDAFDDHITQAMNNGAFTGDPRAIQAWNDARAASAQFKQTFSAVKGDSAGRKIEQIIGRRGNDPLTPNDVADALYGASGTNPGTTNVGVANRVKKILGEQSPEWSAVKQGLWSRLTEKPQGVPEMEPGTISKRLFTFLNGDGRDMANAVFSPQERQMIKNFAELQRQLQPVVGGINRPETSTFVLPMLKKISTNMAAFAGFALAHGFGLGGVGEALVGLASGAAKDFLGNGLNLRKINAQMPLASEAVGKFQKAVAAYNRANSPPSRVALSTATASLVRAFKPLGITFDGALPATGSVPAAAGQQNP